MTYVINHKEVCRMRISTPSTDSSFLHAVKNDKISVKTVSKQIIFFNCIPFFLLTIYQSSILCLLLYNHTTWKASLHY
jgi:hypothetical protein